MSAQVLQFTFTQQALFHYRTAIAFFVTCTLFANALDVTSAQEESGVEAEEVTTGFSPHG